MGIVGQHVGGGHVVVELDAVFFIALDHVLLAVLVDDIRWATLAAASASRELSSFCSGGMMPWPNFAVASSTSLAACASGGRSLLNVFEPTTMAIMPGRITRAGKSIFGMAPIRGVRRAADIDSAAIARCTTRKLVHQ